MQKRPASVRKGLVSGRIALLAKTRGTNRITVRNLLACSALMCVAAISQAAAAQDAAPAGASIDQANADQVTSDQAGPGAIVVTASRTAQNGLDAPTPTQIVGAAAIERQAATTVMDVLNQNPAFKPTRSPGANGSNTSSPGQATADLRALGGQRTLVLINSSRIVPYAPASNLGSPTTTDLNLFPTLMIDRVDIVTGGASALYGSDAVSGVVNLIMKTEYDGLLLTGQAGVSQFGDFGNQRLGGIGGINFNDDRGHFVLSVDYSNNDGVGDQYNRDWGREEWNIVTNGQKAANGLSDLILSPNVHNSLGLGGVIISNIPGLVNQTFNSDGSLRPFQQGSISGGQTMIGGEGTVITTGTDLVPSVRRFTTYGSLYYEFSPAVTGYVEGGYSWSKGQLDGVPIRLGSQAIRRDNAFIPAAVLARLPATTQSFNISRFASDLPNNQYNIYNDVPHGTAGLKGELGGSWRWDAHASYGVNDYSTTIYNNPVTQNIAFAADAVRDPATGQIVCRATLPGASFNAAATGCVPINLFGPGNVSPEGFAYVSGVGQLDVSYKQTTFAANLVGDVFSTWAGPVSVAVGGEYRKESEALTADPIASVNGFLTAGNAVPWSGSFDVKEGYVEATVPLAADMAFARNIDVNGAIRYADYSTAGGQVAWKLGAVWEPFDGFIIRAARSRDIRAPALNELFSPGSDVTNSVTLLVNGRLKSASIPQNASGGNPDLDPEIGETWTAGLAYRGQGALRGLGLSADYYNIKISGAIANLSSVNIASLCGGGDQYFCNLFTYGPDPSNPGEQIHTSLTAPAQNIGAFKQEGVDVTLSYATDLGFLGEGGRYSITGSGTYIFSALVDAGTGAPPVDRAGENNQVNTGAIPTFRGNLSQTLGNDAWELTLQTIFISKGTLDNTYNTPTGSTINDNNVPAVAYLNLFGKVFVEDEGAELFWAINNLLDKDPPPTPYAILNTPTNGQYYDKVGRNFVVGARIRF